ncbi:hypothetical protein ACFLT6_00405 [Chloroflexota bacterium]
MKTRPIMTLTAAIRDIRGRMPVAVKRDILTSIIRELIRSIKATSQAKKNRNLETNITSYSFHVGTVIIS